MQSVSSSAVAQAIQPFLFGAEQSWNNTHTYTLIPDCSYILLCGNPNLLASDIWFVKSRHSTISSLTGYWQSIMKGAYNPTYNLSISGDTLTITGDYCTTALIQLTKTYG